MDSGSHMELHTQNMNRQFKCFIKINKNLMQFFSKTHS